MKKGKVLLLVFMWSLTLTLFTVSAMGARREDSVINKPMTGEETGFQSAETEENESGEKQVKVNGCLSESQLAQIYADFFSGAVRDVYVNIGKDTLLLSGTLAEDSDDVLEEFPMLEDYGLVLKLAENAPVNAEITMTYHKETGYSAEVRSIMIYGVEVAQKDLPRISDGITEGMNKKGEGLDPFIVDKWALLPGGLYYSAVLPDEDSVTALYPSF